MVGGALAIAWAPGVPESKYGESAKPASAAVPVTAEAADGVDADAVEADAVAEPSASNELNEPYEPNDLSGTSPVNGANGRHSAG